MATRGGSEGRGGPEEKPCRTCMDFKSWSKLQKEAMHTNTQQTAKISSESKKSPDHGCPLDVEELGKNTWSVLHTIAAKYPDNPTDHEREGITKLFSLFSEFYPCEVCAEDFKKDLKEIPPRTGSYNEFSQWLCEFHNRVNRKLGKPEFDCKLIDERWRDGWKDGSCD